MRRCKQITPVIEGTNINTFANSKLTTVNDLAYVEYDRGKILAVVEGFICNKQDFLYTDYDVLVRSSDINGEYIVNTQEHVNNLQALEDTPRVFDNKTEAVLHAEAHAKKYKCQIRNVDSDAPIMTPELKQELAKYRKQYDDQFKRMTDAQVVRLALRRLSELESNPNEFIDFSDLWQFQEAVENKLDIIFDRKRYVKKLLISALPVIILASLSFYFYFWRSG